MCVNALMITLSGRLAYSGGTFYRITKAERHLFFKPVMDDPSQVTGAINLNPDVHLHNINDSGKSGRHCQKSIKKFQHDRNQPDRGMDRATTALGGD